MKPNFYFSYHFAASSILTEEIHQEAIERFLAFDKMFEDGIEIGVFKHNITARQLRLYTFAAINGYLLWALDLKLELNDERIDQFVEMAWDAVWSKKINQ